jgi:hypothetical protein
MFNVIFYVVFFNYHFKKSQRGVAAKIRNRYYKKSAIKILKNEIFILNKKKDEAFFLRLILNIISPCPQPLDLFRGHRFIFVIIFLSG